VNGTEALIPKLCLMERLNYIQRTGLNREDISTAINSLNIQQKQSAFYKIKEINAPDKKDEIDKKKLERLVFEDVLTGLHASNIPVVFLLQNINNKISIYIGTWANDLTLLKVRLEILQALLIGSQGYIEYEEKKNFPLNEFERAGIAMGMPCSKIESDNNFPIDRLLQALALYDWQCMILAEPNEETAINTQLDILLKDLRQTLTVVHDSKVPNPISEHYAELLKAGLKHLQLGKEIGSWQVSVYLSGNEVSYYQLASIWKSVYAGEQSRPQPILITEESKVSILLKNLESLNTVGKPGPSLFKHPFQYKTILNSRQLSSYIHLPKVETPGIALIRTINFDSVVESVNSKFPVTLGNVIQRKKILKKIPYEIDVKIFSQHCFIPGMTGSGKTTTIFSILKGAFENGINFLAIESAKTEYRALLNDPAFKNTLQIFTLGNENVSPFRLNPFEVIPGIPVSVHLDLLRSVFSASFGMWTPLPQVLEQCLHKIYEDKGWNLTYNSNHRLDNDLNIGNAYPTLTDLYNKVSIVTQELGYDDKIRDDLRAALTTRINSLRTGGKGKMLDTQSSLPMEVIFNNPTILELEGIGDDDDKAFIMGLIFIKMVEYKRVQKKEDIRQHIMVIEEAHRLLSNASKSSSPEEGNPRGKAVETFNNLLAEIRAYDQGVIIADQSPVKLAPDIIKNTNLKIAHRIVSMDDREVLAGAMAMNSEQSTAFSTLDRGEAIIYSTGDDLPIKIHVENKKSELSESVPTDQTVKNKMSHIRVLPAFKNSFEILPEVKLSSPSVYLAEKAAQRVISDARYRFDFIKFIFHILESEDLFVEAFQELQTKTQQYIFEKMDRRAFEIYVLRNSAEWYSSEKGEANGWTFNNTIEFKTILIKLLLNFQNGNFTFSVDEFREVMFRLDTRSYDPFLCCSKICFQRKEQPRMCLYRFAVQEVIGDLFETKSVGFIDAYLDGLQDDNTIDPTNMELKLKAQCGSIISESINTEAERRIKLCYAQHMVKALSNTDQTKILSSIEFYNV
jgi:hypothetical protein